MTQTLRYAFAENPSLVPDTESPSTTPDLSITRATKATMVDADGYIREVQSGEARFDGATFRHNLARFSEALDSWGTKTNVTVADDDDSINGISLSKITDDATNAEHSIAQSNSLPNPGGEGLTILVSVYVKGGTSPYVGVSLLGTGADASIFNTSTGVWDTEGANYANHGSEDLGGGYYRIWMTTTANSRNDQVIAMSSDGSTLSYSGGGDTIFAGGFMVENVSGSGRTTPGTYIETSSTTPVSSLSGTSNGLLVEEARTNICLQSEDFSTTWTTTNATISANATTAPDGSTTADQLTSDSSGLSRRINQVLTTVGTGGTSTLSIFAKPGTQGSGWIRMDVALLGSQDTFAYFDIVNGTVGATLGADVTATSITAFNDGWYRCSVSFAEDASDDSGIIRAFLADADNDTNSTAGDNIYLWGAQLEVGAFPTSYISTTTASVSRNADVVTGTLTGTEINNSGGSFYAKYSLNALTPNGFILQVDDGSFNDRYYHYLDTGLDLDWVISSTAGNDALILPPMTAVVDTIYQAVMGYEQDNVTAYLDGALSDEDSSFDIITTPMTRIGIGQATHVGTLQPNGLIKEIRYYDERPDNTGLENLSNGLFPIPDVVDFTSAGATTLLEANGFVADTTTTAYSDTIAAGNVIEQTAAAGTYAANGTTVVLTISLGPNPESNAGGWLNEYNAYKQRKASQEKHRKEVLQAVRELDGIDGEIAELMQLDQAKEDEQKRIAEFRAMLDKEISKAKLDKAGLLNKRINRAYDRAMQKATYSAIEALEREIEQAIEEEEFLFIVMSIQ